MAQPLLPSLEIDNYRLFRHLTVSRLARVNLIVGKNSAGKTSLLEALRIYARKGSPSLLWELLELRDEAAKVVRPPIAQDAEINGLELGALFHDRPSLDTSPQSIQIGPVNSPASSVRISVGWYAVQIDDQGFRKLRSLDANEGANVDETVLGVAVQNGQGGESIHRLDTIGIRRRPKPEVSGIPEVFVPANGLQEERAAEYFDNITLLDLQDKVEEILRLIEPGIERINFVEGSDTRRPRVPVAKLSQPEGRVPLRSLGEGMTRLLNLALAVTNAENGILLIDEVESGIHYSVQPGLWKVLHELARRLNVQVFATTHSWDCIEAFQKTIAENAELDGTLIRLTRRQDDVQATVFGRSELDVIARDQLEVR